MNIQTVNPNLATAVNLSSQSNPTLFPYTTHMPELRKGQAGEAVAFVQKFLIAYGYSLALDGNFGLQTQQAVKNFQSNNTLSADGILGKDTWRAISGSLPIFGNGIFPSNPNASGINLPVLQIGIAGEAVRFLQENLIAYGFPVTFDGQFGPQTQQAVKNLQSWYGLSADGILGKDTWRAISNNFYLRA